MKEQLIQYVELLFAGAAGAEDIKQEILQNTLDRYDDLIAQGKSPEAAYRLAISGIGDINEILGGRQKDNPPVKPASTAESQDTPMKKLLRAVAVGLYILCPIPLFVLSEFGMETLGLCGLLTMVAVATVLMILGKKRSGVKDEDYREENFGKRASPRQELRSSVKALVWAVGLAIYFILSFVTMAWYITWVIFPIIGAVQGLILACMDLKEAK